jgi:hypothetical protein
MECFQDFLKLIAKAPILSFPNFTLAFSVATDASNVGIAAVLYQSPNGEFMSDQTKYIVSQSRALNNHEKNLFCLQKGAVGCYFCLSTII